MKTRKQARVEETYHHELSWEDIVKAFPDLFKDVKTHQIEIYFQVPSGATGMCVGIGRENPIHVKVTRIYNE